MAEIKYFNSKLAEYAEWDIGTIKKLINYTSTYETIPNYKKTLNSMIRFSEMYRPIIKGGKYIDVFGTLTSTNEHRSIMRAQVYMNKKDLLNTFDKKTGRKLVVTSRGHKIYYEDYPLSKLRDRGWNGIWTIIMYDIPIRMNYERNNIREKLKKLGFGSPQQSILVTPLPLYEAVQELIEGEKVENYTWVLRAKKILGMGDREIAKKSWPLNELNDLYQKLNDVLESIKSLKQRKKKEELTEEWKYYFLSVNSVDPYLPKELLPSDWQGYRCERKFIKLGSVGFLKALFKRVL